MQRRPFLATLGATAAAFTTGARAQEPAGKKLGWALVGLGSLSTKQIAPAFAKSKHCKLAAIVTGLLMMNRVRTAVFERNPYIMGDGAWGFTYVLHGLAGVGFVGTS